VGTAAVGFWEVRTSTFQARYFSSVASELGYAVEPGPSSSIRFPEEGPFDQRLGYTEIPRFQKAVEEAGFSVVEQARVSARFSQLMDGGLFPIYREKSQGGLRVLDRRGGLFHASPHPARVYTEFDSIPELLWRSLVFIENREFLDPTRPTKNPAVEWDRIARGVVDMVLRKLGSDRNVPGGSTLATQAEKFRHSPEGRTSSARAKLQQMASASFRAYLDGEETLEAQKEIVRAYLNSVPLAAQRGHGEVTGTADGLWAWYGTEFETANRLLRGVGLDGEEREERALVYRQALSLLIAHRRPSYYLADEQGRRDLAEITAARTRGRDPARSGRGRLFRRGQGAGRGACPAAATVRRAQGGEPGAHQAALAARGAPALRAGPLRPHGRHLAGHGLAGGGRHRARPYGRRGLPEGERLRGHAPARPG
jgi:hypothetical protein